MLSLAHALSGIYPQVSWNSRQMSVGNLILALTVNSTLVILPSDLTCRDRLKSATIFSAQGSRAACLPDILRPGAIQAVTLSDGDGRKFCQRDGVYGYFGMQMLTSAPFQ